MITEDDNDRPIDRPTDRLSCRPRVAFLGLERIDLNVSHN